MKAFDTANDKVKKLCEVLKSDTLEPAKQEAAQIIEHAHAEAKRIIEEGKQNAQLQFEEAKKRIDQEKKVFETSVGLAAKQAISSLKQEVENLILNRGIEEIVKKTTTDEQTAGKLVEALIASIQDAGIDGKVVAYLPKHISKEHVLSVVGKEALELINDEHLSGGVRVKIVDQNLVLDCSDQVLKELIAQYIREELRERIFNA